MKRIGIPARLSMFLFCLAIVGAGIGGLHGGTAAYADEPTAGSGSAAPGTEARELAMGPLADYVRAEDTSYGWEVRRTGDLGTARYAELRLTSQTWQDVRWKHQLYLLHPASARPENNHALLFITGGSWNASLDGPSNGESLPGEALAFAALAENLGTPVAILLHVPHQPLFNGLREDEIISLTFEEYLRSGDPQWPLLLPMVKSAVAGMDATTEYAAEQWEMEIESFTVTGASKRGWTTWLTGAVDARATAIAPMVIDMLRMTPQLEHQEEAWGGLSYKIDDYTERGLHEQLRTPRGRQLQEIVDPYHYRQVLTQPKLIILGTNDHYWPLDALNLYWDDLEEPKYALYVPNNRHSLSDLRRVVGSLQALHAHAIGSADLPELTWEYEQTERGLQLSVATEPPADHARVWLAASPSRDFREAEWAARELTVRDGGRFGFTLFPPESGYAAVFGEAEYEGAAGPAFFSTTVRILGETTE